MFYHFPLILHFKEEKMKYISLTLLFFILSFCNNIFAQYAPPKAGNYNCFTAVFAVGVGATAVNGKIIYGDAPLQPIPAVFGDIIIDGQGNYKLTNAKGIGKYIFNKVTSKLSFTGDLSVMKVEEYNDKKYTFFLIYKDLSFQCSLRGFVPDQTNKDKSISILNEGLTGKILTTTSYKYNNFFGSVFEFDLNKGISTIIFQNGVASQNLKGDIFYFDRTSRMKITDKTGNSIIKQLSDKVTYDFEDLYPAISNSGEYIAFTIPHKSDAGSFKNILVDGIKLVIADSNGVIKAEFKNYTQAAWMLDGRIIVVGDGKSNQGLFIIDAKFKSVNKLVDGFNYAQMPAVSPDGKTVAFSEKGEIWSVNLDGSKPRKLIFGNETLFPAWSPDGKRIAANVRLKLNGIDRSLLYIVNLKEEKGFYVTGNNGDYVESRNRITWLP
jgi:WD40-like Beta Propeller Repeat